MTKVIEPWMEEAACYFLFRKEGRYSSVEEIKELAQDIADCMPDGWADSQTGGQWPTPTAPPDELAQAKAMARKVGYGSGSLASVIENLAELAATARRALDDLVKMRSVCRNPNHALADGTPHLHEIGPSCMAEIPAEVEYWKSRAETAELKVLTFHEEIAKLRGEQKG